MQQNQIMGAIKIKDGLFIGDEFAAQDFEFIVLNKVSHVINCAGTQIQNKFTEPGIKYLTFNWIESDNEILFDDRDENLNEIYQFMEGCFDLGESCLVHSVRGQSRSCCVLAAYFMKKYCWTLYKTLEYLNSRRPDLEIRASFFYQLNELEKKFSKTSAKRTCSWNELNEDGSNQIQQREEEVIRNTYVNSHNGQVDEVYTNLQTKMTVLNKLTKQKLKWRDQTSNKENMQLATVVYNNSPDYLPVTDKNIPTKNHYFSILKGSQSKVFKVTNTNEKQQQLKKSVLQSTSTQATSQLKSLNSKSQENQIEQYQPIIQHQHQPSNQTFSQASIQQLSNNPSFNNLLISCSMKLQQKQDTKKDQQQPQSKPIKPLAGQISQPSSNLNSLTTQSLASPQVLVNNLMKQPLQNIQIVNQAKKVLETKPLLKREESQSTNMLRSTSLQQFEDKKNNVPERTHSVKEKLESEVYEDKQILNSFQDFKNQVQMSLNYFNNKDYQPKQPTKPSEQRETFQVNPLRLSLQPDLFDKEKVHKQQRQLDQLISPTMVNQQKLSMLNMNTSSSFQNLSKGNKDIQTSIFNDPLKNSATNQIQSSFQKFQQLQQTSLQSKKDNNYPLKTYQSSSQISHSKQPTQILKTSFDNLSQLRSSSVPKKNQDDLLLNKRPCSAESQKPLLTEVAKQPPKKPNDQRKDTSIKKEPSPSSLKCKIIKMYCFNEERKSPNQTSFGPPLPQSTSHLYLRNVQSRRQAASTLRNQRPVNSTFQERILSTNNFSNSYTNISQNSYANNNNSYLNDHSLVDRSKYGNLEKQVEILNQNRTTLLKNFNNEQQQPKAENFTNFKQQAMPNNTQSSAQQQFVNSKSQTSFQKNQPVRQKFIQIILSFLGLHKI